MGTLMRTKRKKFSSLAAEIQVALTILKILIVFRLIHIHLHHVSDLGAEMYTDGFHNITNVDISEVVVSFMRCKSHPSDIIYTNLRSHSGLYYFYIAKFETFEDMEFTVMDVSSYIDCRRVQLKNCLIYILVFFLL